MHPDADAYFKEQGPWHEILKELRKILLSCGLTETWKWSAPCYMLNKANVVILYRFKDSCGLGFFKGALLPDPAGWLAKPGENTRYGRVIRFTEVADIRTREMMLKQYIGYAMEAERSGQKLPDSAGEVMPEVAELHQMFEDDAGLKAAFERLTPGRQRAYLLFFSGAKQSATRQERVRKYIPRILAGKGINDCICGLSKRMPQCDGSHKFATEQPSTAP